MNECFIHQHGEVPTPLAGHDSVAIDPTNFLIMGSRPETFSSQSNKTFETYLFNTAEVKWSLIKTQFKPNPRFAHACLFFLSFSLSFNSVYYRFIFTC